MWIFTKKSFYYQNAEFCHHDKFWVEALVWKKSGCNKLTKMSCKSRRSFCCEIFYLIELYVLECRGSHWRGARGPCRHPPSPHPTSSSEPNKANKIQQFPFQHIRNIAFNRCSEIIRPEISRFLPCLLQFLDNLWRLFIFLTTYGK